MNFWAPWCEPCATISPVFEKLAEEDRSSQVKFCKVNIDSLPDVASQYGIRAIPTFMTFMNAEKLDVVSGAGVSQLTDFIKPSAGV
ncbi:thioredoxin-like protein [Melampsora americana]|nr:thioredoxin-like protein [Melampsora americana]